MDTTFEFSAWSNAASNICPSNNSKRDLATIFPFDMPEHPEAFGFVVLEVVMFRFTPYTAIQQSIFAHRQRSSVAFRSVAFRFYTWRVEKPKETPKYKVLFFGTDEFSASHLKALIQEKKQPDSCIASIDLVCPPDQMTGRKRNILTPAATKGLAELYNIPVHHTPPRAETLDNWEVPGKFDLGVVVSFGYFIPPKVIESFEKGAINVHPSLLPKFRGAAPIQHTILRGEGETGVTIQELDDKEFDAGRILAQQKVDLSEDNAPRFKDLRDRLSIVGQHILVDTLRNFDECKRLAKPQDPNAITKAPKIKKEWAEIDFENMESWQIEQLHRAIGEQYPLRTTFTFSRIKRSKKVLQKYIQMQMFNIFIPEDSPIYHEQTPPEPGQFIFEDATKTLHVACADGNAIAFTHIKADSKDTISVKDFVNGYEIHGGYGQFGVFDEDYVKPGKSGVRVTKRRHEYAKSIRKRLGMRRFEYDYHYHGKTSGRR